MRKAYISSAVLVFTVLLLQTLLFSAQLSEDTIAKKNEGWYPTGLPLVNFSSDDGFGYGARAYIYNNGHKDDPYFDKSPYFLQLYAQYFATTNGVQYHELNLDMPYFLGTKFRIQSAFAYDRALNSNYFGVGEQASHEKLTAPNGNKYNTYAGLQDFFDDNKQNTKWYNFTITRPTYTLYVFRDITDEFKLMAGAMVKNVTIETWNGRKFKNTRQDPTLLDNDRAKLTDSADGQLGGLINTARLGVTYDARDFEPDPHKGYYLDYVFEASNGAIGSDFNYIKNNVQAMYFVNPFDSFVLGGRLGYTTAAGDIPFYEESFFGFANFRREGLGGNRTLLGYKKNRFVAKTMTVANLDARWQFWEVSGAGQRFGFQLIAFIESGNVYDEAADPVQDPNWKFYHTSYGGGLVIAWNLSTIVHFLYGMSKEDANISIDFDHKF